MLSPCTFHLPHFCSRHSRPNNQTLAATNFTLATPFPQEPAAVATTQWVLPLANKYPQRFPPWPIHFRTTIHHRTCHYASTKCQSQSLLHHRECSAISFVVWCQMWCVKKDESERIRVELWGFIHVSKPKSFWHLLFCHLAPHVYFFYI